MTSAPGDVWGEGIASSGTVLHVIYGTNEVRYRRSPDQGTTWESDRPIDDGVIHLTDPIVADGEDVWVVVLKDIQNATDWCCSRDLGNIYLLHSGDGGDTWDQPRQLTTTRGAFRVSIAYASGRLHLVWMDYRGGAWDTYYLRSSNRGSTWDSERRIATSAGTFGAERPQIAAAGDHVHVTIWDDRGTNPPCMAGPTFSFSTCPDTFYLGSIDGGDTWGEEIPVSYSGAAIAGRNDVAVAGAASVVINFNRSTENTADANPHMFVVRSGDNGATWDDPVQLTDTPGSSDHGSIIGFGSDVHLAWHDSRDGSLAIYYSLSTNEGVAWTDEERVSTASGTESSTPLVAVTAAYAHLLWLDHRGGSYQVYYRRRAVAAAPPGADGGVGVGPDGNPDSPPMASDSGCGCRASARGRGDGWAALLLGVFARRRRTRRPE